MSDHTRPFDARDGADGAPHAETKEGGDIHAWLEWFQDSARVGTSLTSLAAVEAKLALSDLQKIIAVGIMMLPIAYLAWIGLSVLLSWLVVALTDSIGLGITTFLAVQVISLLVMKSMISKFSKSLKLPATRKQLEEIREGLKNGAQRTHH